MRLDVLRDDIYDDDNIVSTKTNADAAEKQKKEEVEWQSVEE